MPQCSFSARKDEGLLALLSVLLLSPKAPLQEEIYIPRFPCLSRAFCKALLLQALHTHELDWHRGSVSIPSGSASISLTFYTKSVIWRHRWQLSCEFPPSVAGNCLVLLPWLLCELDRRADLALNCITCSCYMALKEVILQAWLQLWCVLQHGHTKMCTFAVLDWEAERVKKKKRRGEDYSRLTLTDIFAKFFVLSSHGCVCHSHPFLLIPFWVALLVREEEAFTNKVWVLSSCIQ